MVFDPIVTIPPRSSIRTISRLSRRRHPLHRHRTRPMSITTRVPTPSADHQVHQLLSSPLGAHSSDQQYMQVFVPLTHSSGTSLQSTTAHSATIYLSSPSLSLVFSKRINQATFCHCCPVRLLSMPCRGQKTKANTFPCLAVLLTLSPLSSLMYIQTGLSSQRPLKRLRSAESLLSS